MSTISGYTTTDFRLIEIIIRVHITRADVVRLKNDNKGVLRKFFFFFRRLITKCVQWRTTVLRGCDEIIIHTDYVACAVIINWIVRIYTIRVVNSSLCYTFSDVCRNTFVIMYNLYIYITIIVQSAVGAGRHGHPRTVHGGRTQQIT